MPDEPREWYTVAQVAALVQVNEETVRRWIREGELPVLNVGKGKLRPDYRIRRTDLDDFIAGRHGSAKSEAVA